MFLITREDTFDGERDRTVYLGVWSTYQRASAVLWALRQRAEEPGRLNLIELDGGGEFLSPIDTRDWDCDGVRFGIPV